MNGNIFNISAKCFFFRVRYKTHNIEFTRQRKIHPSIKGFVAEGNPEANGLLRV